MEPCYKDNGYNIGWIAKGEWTAYTLDMAKKGVYELELRLAAKGRGGRLHLEVDGADVSESVTIPDTGSWQKWTSIKVKGIQLKVGKQVLKIVCDKDPYNLNYLVFRRLTP